MIRMDAIPSCIRIATALLRGCLWRASPHAVARHFKHSIATAIPDAS